MQQLHTLFLALQCGDGDAALNTLKNGTAGVHDSTDFFVAQYSYRMIANTLVRIKMDRALGNGPRGVGFGSTEEEIVSVYKDFGQLQSPNGERGLYYDYPNVGKVRVEADGTRMVEYSCITAASDIWVLQYRLGANGRANEIIHYYQP